MLGLFFAFVCACAFASAEALCWFALREAVPEIVRTISQNRYYADFARVTTMLASAALGLALFIVLWGRLEREPSMKKRLARSVRWCLGALIAYALAKGGAWIASNVPV